MFVFIKVTPLRKGVLWCFLLAVVMLSSRQAYAVVSVLDKAKDWKSKMVDTPQRQTRPSNIARQRRSAHRATILQSFFSEDPNAVDPYTHGFLWGMGLNSDGWRMTFRWLRTVDAKNSYHIQADISEIFDPKERIVDNPYYSFGGLYYRPNGTMTDGKINIFYPLRIGWGWNRYIVNKATHLGSGGFLQLFANAGLILGIQKPYNLEIIDDKQSSGTRVISFTREDGIHYMNYEVSRQVRGRTARAFFSGWDQITLIPGGFIEGGLRFGFSKGAHFFSAINLGMGIDVYTQHIPLILYSPQKQSFYRIFIAFEIGGTKVKR